MKHGAKNRSNTGVELMMHYLSYDYIHNIVLAEWGVGGGRGEKGVVVVKQTADLLTG